MPFEQDPSYYQDEESKKLLANNQNFSNKNTVDPVVISPMYRIAEFALRAGVTFLISGEPGTGKTTAIIKFGVKYGIPVYIIPCHSSMPKSSLIGKRIFNPHKGIDGDERETLFVPLGFLKGYEKGFITVGDDFLQTTENIMTEAMEFAMMPDNYNCTDEDGKIYEKHPNFRFVATGNLNYEGSHSAPTALNSRFGLKLKIGRLTKKAFLLVEKSKAPWLSDAFFNQAYDLCTSIIKEGEANHKPKVPCGVRALNAALKTIFEEEIDTPITLEDFSMVVEAAFVNCLYTEKVPEDKIEAFRNTPVVQAFITKMFNEYKSSPRPLAPGMSQQAQAVQSQQIQQPINPPTPKSGMDLFDDLYGTRI